jgi:hypothetical protein
MRKRGLLSAVFAATLFIFALQGSLSWADCSDFEKALVTFDRARATAPDPTQPLNVLCRFVRSLKPSFEIMMRNAAPECFRAGRYEEVKKDLEKQHAEVNALEKELCH